MKHLVLLFTTVIRVMGPQCDITCLSSLRSSLSQAWPPVQPLVGHTRAPKPYVSAYYLGGCVPARSKSVLRGFELENNGFYLVHGFEAAGNRDLGSSFSF